MVKIEIPTKQMIKRMIANDTAGFYRRFVKLENRVRELEEKLNSGKVIIK